MSKEIKIAYIGKVAPYEPEFYNMPGYGVAGTLAQLGFIEALYSTKMGLDRVWGFRPIAHWPHVAIQFEKPRICNLSCGATIRLLPLINHFILREISWFVSVACCIIFWSLMRIGKKRILVIYNLSQPTGIVWARLWTWLTHTKLVPIVYDMAQIKSFKKSFLVRMTEPDWLDRLHERFMPLCDGLMTITDAIVKDFAPKTPYLRVDGGVGDAVVKALPPLLERTEVDSVDRFVLFYAGSLEKWNSIRLFLDYMKSNPDVSLRLWIAGSGRELDTVLDSAEKDKRIEYIGNLSQNDLYDRYIKADVLLNIRDNTDIGLKYHYPSKTFEMMAMGRPMIVTNLAHTKQMYGKYCKVIDAADLPHLTEGVEFFRRMTAKERFEYGKMARDFILKQHRWISWGDSIGSFLYKVVK